MNNDLDNLSTEELRQLIMNVKSVLVKKEREELLNAIKNSRSEVTEDNNINKPKSKPTKLLG